jgi:hypothetical protein
LPRMSKVAQIRQRFRSHRINGAYRPNPDWGGMLGHAQASWGRLALLMMEHRKRGDYGIAARISIRYRLTECLCVSSA